MSSLTELRSARRGGVSRDAWKRKRGLLNYSRFEAFNFSDWILCARSPLVIGEREGWNAKPRMKLLVGKLLLLGDRRKREVVYT